MSDIASALVGRDLGALHEVPNQIDCFRPVTRWAEALTETAAIPTSLAAAFELTRTGRPGPVALSIPNDLLFARAEATAPPPSTARRPPCHVADVETAARRLRVPTRPRPAFTAGAGGAGDGRGGLARLVQALGPGPAATGWDRAWLAESRKDAGPRFTPEVAGAIATLRRALPDDAIVVNDQTGLTYWMEYRFPVYAPRTFLYPTGSAVLGYAVPAAIGAKLARPERAVVAVAGDGGFMFSVAELATAGEDRLAVVFLVVNDERYGAIKYLQQRMYEGRWGEADLSNPDFPALARAFGARGERLAGIDSRSDAIGRALAAAGPTLLELRMTIEPPWE